MWLSPRQPFRSKRRFRRIRPYPLQYSSGGQQSMHRKIATNAQGSPITGRLRSREACAAAHDSLDPLISMFLLNTIGEPRAQIHPSPSTWRKGGLPQQDETGSRRTIWLKPAISFRARRFPNRCQSQPIARRPDQGAYEAIRHPDHQTAPATTRAFPVFTIPAIAPVHPGTTT